MTWKPPESEDAWLECLSAYLDGEMSVEDRRALEKVIETDPQRAEQLHALRQTSRLLEEWDVDAPEPQPAFLQQLDRTAEGAESNIRWRGEIGNMGGGGSDKEAC